MAGLLLGASSSLPATIVQGPPSNSDKVVSAFEKELSHLLLFIKKPSKTAKQDDQFIQKCSNAIFKLWSTYESKLPVEYFTSQLLAFGDTLCRCELYTLASTHCYGRYLHTHYDPTVPLIDTVSAITDNRTITALLRALIGDAVCQYQTVKQTKPGLVDTHTVERVLTQLQLVSQAALSHEPLYWLVHNSLLLIFSICRQLMMHASLVLEFLLWGAVCMESSVPLMASKYLSIRVNYYTAVCQCFNHIQQPHQAELFARRALDKVHELAQLEGASTEQDTQELSYREASLKLGVVIFKRSVFLSRKKMRPGFRPKVRPTIHELIQAPSPRSPTEKLLTEMFNGCSAQFLAVLESLVDSNRRPLFKGPPPTPLDTELDQETITDVYQELFCIGVDLALQALEGSAHNGSLLENAVNEGDYISLDCLVQFVRVAYCSDQREVVELLADRLVQDTQVCECSVVRSSGKALQLVLMVDSLSAMFKKYKTNGPQPTSTSSALPQSVSDVREDSGTTAEDLFSKLQDTLSLLALAVADKVLLATDTDLLVDCAVLIWDMARPAFSLIASHDYSTCRQFLSHSAGNQYVVFLAQLVEVLMSLEFWQVDPMLQGELCLKLACLYEARAQLKLTSRPAQDYTLLYDRSLLLECLAELERGVLCIKRARTEDSHQLELLHGQFLFAVTRVKLKLASTIIPPPCPKESTRKPSSLKSKIEERREKASQRAKMLSELTAPTVRVGSVTELRKQCGTSSYKLAVLTMLQASLDPQLDQTAKQTLLEESNALLKRSSDNKTTQCNGELPPPNVLHVTDTCMTFEPRPFADETLQCQVFCYKLFGRNASGSNVKVRLADHNLLGLGLEVPIGRVLCVNGLEPNQEYVFALCAYSSSGQIIGGSIGATSQPVLSSYSFPVLSAWGELAKIAYTCGVHSLAGKICDNLWTEFVETDNQTFQLKHAVISNTHSSIVKQFAQCVLIQAKLLMAQGGLLADKLCTEGPLRPSQLARLNLAQRLLVAAELGAMLNDGSLCVQAVTMMYGVLAPLVHYSVQTDGLLGLLMHCFAVLTECPEAVHTNKQAVGLHHMIAGLGYYLGKVTIEDKALFSLITDNARSLLIATMPVSTAPNEPSPSNEGLQQASLLSGSINPSLTSYTTVSSGLPSLLPQTGQAKKKKARVKKLTASIDEISDESKSPEFKAFEGFLLTHIASSVSDDLDLTGQEDPVLLHAVIATQTSNTAHREVHKFRRRPQYLEYFVHLANTTRTKGYTERVLDWCKEAFGWLSRRNELLLSTKGSMAQSTGKQDKSKQQGKNISANISRVTSALGSSLNDGGGKRLSSSLNLTKHPNKQIPTLGSSLNVTSGRRPARHLSREVSSCGPSLNVGQLKHLSLGGSLNPRTSKLFLSQHKTPQAALAKLSSSKTRRLQPIMSTKVLDTVRITRDDIEAKAFAVIITVLPAMWKTHRARKRLRGVCSLELPWRAQANLIQATCHLELLEKRLTGWSKGSPPCTLDVAGAIIDGVVPVYTKALAGQTSELPKESSSSAVLLSELQQMMVHYQRAITLAHRGSHWILVQNITRSLLNAVTSLSSQLTKEPSLLAGLYGEALRPLYSSTSALLDMLLHSGVAVSGCLLPEALSLQYTPLMDQCDSVGMAVLKRLVLLTIHVLYVHEHWEKLVTVAVRFDDITKHSWGDILVPVLSTAQTKLSSRMTEHPVVKTVRIEPGAHLDPGPKGYNVYGGVGHSLGMTRASLSDPANRAGHGICLELAQPRRLKMVYLQGSSPAVSLSDVIRAYDNAVTGLADKGDSDLLVQAMQELGDIILHTNTRSASQWWRESLCVLLSTREPLNVNTDNSSVGLWGALLAAHISVKLARYVHCEELDVRLQYSLLCASLCKTALGYTLPTPTSEHDFIKYPQDSNVFPGVELFSDLHRLSPNSLMDSLHWACQELLLRGHSLKVLPMLWLYGHLAWSVCRHPQHTVTVKLLRLQAFTQLHLFEEALLTLSELLAGVGLPGGSSDRHMEIHWVFLGFSNSLPLSDPKNIKCVQTLSDKPLSARLADLYGADNVTLLSIARAQLYIALAESLSPLHHTPVIRRGGDTPMDSRSPATLLAPNVSLAVSTLQVGGSSRCASSAVRRTKTHDNKQSLLDNAEKLLAPLSKDCQHPDVQIRALLELARIARVYSHQSTAVQLGLAALRTMQVSDESYDPLLWLKALHSFCEGLIGSTYTHSKVLDCLEQCENAVHQCEALGDYQLAAKLHYTAALHCMTSVPQDLNTITTHCQNALRVLERLSVLTPCSTLLRSQVTLLLADVSCVPGVNSGDMVNVFKGLVAMLNDQLDTESDHPNIYVPQRLVLAAAHLRLCHTLCVTEGSIESALSSCEIGLSMLKSCSLSDPCLMAELLLHQGWLLSLSDDHAAMCSLLEATNVIAESGVQPKLAVWTLYKLAELSNRQKTEGSHCESHDMSRIRSQEHSSRNKDRERLSYTTWLLVKLGVRTEGTLDLLQEFISQASNEDAIRPLSTKVIAELPDCVVLDLCSTEETTAQLASSAQVPSIKTLLPSCQSVLTTELNMLKIAGYLSHVMKQIGWQKPLLDCTGSNWYISHHTLTSTLYPKAKALLDFITTYCQHFKSLKIPVLPASMFPLKGAPSCTPEPYVHSGEAELTVVWAQPYPLESSTDDMVIGYFAMNAKSISTQSAAGNAQSAGLETHIVRSTLRALEGVCSQWEELTEMTTAYVDSKTSQRPVSRSPSKQKKSERALKMPPEIVDRCTQAVRSLKQTLGITSTEVPRLELHNVGTVTKLLKPYTCVTVKGELYHFFRALFASS